MSNLFVSEDFYRILFLASIAAFILVLIMGAQKKIVIYMDKNDLTYNQAPLAILLIGFLLFGFFESVALRTIIIYVTIISIFCLLIYNFKKSLEYNSFLDLRLNILIATIKLLFSLLAGLLSIFSIFHFFFSSRSWKDELIFGLIFAGINWLQHTLVNGHEVYERLNAQSNNQTQNIQIEN